MDLVCLALGRGELLRPCVGKAQQRFVPSQIRDGAQVGSKMLCSPVTSSELLNPAVPPSVCELGTFSLPVPAWCLHRLVPPSYAACRGGASDCSSGCRVLGVVSDTTRRGTGLCFVMDRGQTNNNLLI